MRKTKYRDFSEMSSEDLEAFARDMANPVEAVKRIRAERRRNWCGGVGGESRLNQQPR